ncbi:MAG: Uncharacterized protein G01um101448_363 [Parcubacteria group bacterium Gr01-1014_48]|nr:MAG: Uncharacterized protein Greene041614_245 [Parcubacteria group bacterium Greene0416_14]TSC74060.1 MAG: Uncharacterized protein G01um101448_363 [Parcubacteria group bacterium Gr01-1014_48]TSD01152.1 MAG: Uncharacterized protein Greene101415_455 [Parcubacteria group bacterium Greene1014_15]TSD08228.1 MAG: Uncharacterized protein Greene07144_298 [Parcubacteria group bacterium Greene0714_4]
MTISDFVRQRKYLFWSTRNYDGLSKEAIVEAVLNYGDMKDVREMISILGMQETAKIFHAQTNPNRARINYRADVKNYFKLYFEKYA